MIPKSGSRFSEKDHAQTKDRPGRRPVRLKTEGASCRNSSMIWKSVKRFSEKIMLKQQP
jgi:hypothetical protein